MALHPMTFVTECHGLPVLYFCHHLAARWGLLRLPQPMGVFARYSSHERRVMVQNQRISSGQRPLQILIVDSHAAVRKALGIRLSVSDRLNVVGTAATLDDAAETLRQLPVDVIVMGLRRRDDRTVYQTAHQIEQLMAPSAETGHHAPAIIVLSPFSDEVERQTLLKAGASHYLLKHIDTPTLIEAIEDGARISAEIDPLPVDPLPATRRNSDWLA